MTDDFIKLGKRAVACRGWQWMPGMRTVDAMRVIHDPDRWPDRPCAIREGGWIDTSPPRPLKDDLPDLTDPATLGCLLALVREAWESPKANISWVTDENCMVVFDPRHAQRFLLGDTEAEALVAALESAP